MIRRLEIAAVAFSALFLGLVVTFVVAERTWIAKEPQSPRDYFVHGSTGTELMPLAVFEVLPTLFPDHFQPAGPEAGDWITQFGFVRTKGDENHGLPVGINVSRYRPKSGAPSPVDFVGFNCAVCHTGSIRRSDTDDGIVVYGMANSALDLVAFGDAIKSSLLDEKRLTLGAIESAYEAKHREPLGLLDRVAIWQWLRGARKSIRADLPMR